MKEQLEQLQSELILHYPQLVEINQIEIIPNPEPLILNYNLFLQDQERSCAIYRYGTKGDLRCVFQWDSCNLFEIYTQEVKRLGKIILKWVLKKTMPSNMKTEFPELPIGLVAKYYEKGEGVKGEFIESWNLIESHFKHFNTSGTHRKNALELIQEMRVLKLDEKLRAGQSLYFLILSRKRRHGLRDDTAYIRIQWAGKNRMVINYFFKGMEENHTENMKEKCEHSVYNIYNPRESIIECEAKYEGQLEELINRLLKEKIE